MPIRLAQGFEVLFVCQLSQGLIALPFKRVLGPITAEATSVAVVMHCECKGGEREQQQQEQTLDLETSYLLSLLNQTVGVYLILNG